MKLRIETETLLETAWPQLPDSHRRVGHLTGKGLGLISALDEIRAKLGGVIGHSALNRRGRVVTIVETATDLVPVATGTTEGHCVCATRDTRRFVRWYRRFSSLRNLRLEDWGTSPPSLADASTAELPCCSRSPNRH